MSFQRGAKEECAVCFKPVYPVERMAIQNILLHHTCFCCTHCGRKLSLLNYAIFNSAFYCKVHHKLLSEIKGSRQEENTSIPQKYQQLQKAKQPSPRLGSKSRSSQTGQLLIREKIQPRLCGLQTQASLKSPRQTRQLACETASWNKLQIHWPPLNEDDTGRKCYRSEIPKKLLPNPIMLLRSQNRTDRNHCKALRDESIIAANAQAEKKQCHFLTVTFPKSAEAVLYQAKIVDGNREPGVLAKRPFFMDERTFRAQAREEGQSISEKATPFQHNQLKPKRSISVVSPCTSIPPAKPFSVRFFPSCSEPLRMKKVTHFAATGVPGASLTSNFTRSASEGQKLSRSSSSKGDSDGRDEKQLLKRTEPLPKTKVKLPGLLPPNCRQKKHLETNKSNTLVTSILEEAEQSSHAKAKAAGGHNASQANPEVAGYLPELQDEKSHKAEHDDKTLVSCLDSMNTHKEDNQDIEQSWVGSSEFPREQGQVVYPTSFQRSENENQKIQHEKVDVKKKEDMQLGRKPDSFMTLNCIPDQACLDTRPERRETEMGNDHSVSSSQADDPENMMTLPRGHLQDISWTCDVTPSAHENQEPVNIASTDEELPREASNENNILQSQEEQPGGTVLQASAPQIKEAETFNSCEVAYLTENQVMGNINVDMKPQNGDVMTIQGTHNYGTTDVLADKQPLNKEKNQFACLFESKIQTSNPKQKPAETKKTPKIQSAFVTLFGHSLGKDKNPKERPRKASAKPLVETSNESRLEDACSPNIPRPGFSEEASEVATQTMSLEVNPQDSEENCGSYSKDGQRESFPPLDSSKGLNTELGTDFPSSSIMSPVAKNPEVLKQSNLNWQTLLRDPSKPSQFAQIQNLLATTDNILQGPASSLVKTDPEIMSGSRGGLDDQDLSNLTRLNYQDLEITVQSVSLLNPLREGEFQFLDQDYHDPNTLLFSMEVEGSANVQGRNPRYTPHMATVPMEDKSSSGLNSSENVSQVNNPHQLPEFGTPTLVKDGQLNNKDPPESGNSEMFPYGDPQFWHQFNADNTIGVSLLGGQATMGHPPIERDQFSPLLAPLQHIPELLRDTIKGKVEETAERPLQDLMLAEKSNQLPASPS